MTEDELQMSDDELIEKMWLAFRYGKEQMRAVLQVVRAHIDAAIDEIARLQAELSAARAEADEPVAWYLPSEGWDDSAFRDHRTVVACTGNKWEGWIPLYTHPSRREPLTDEAIRELWSWASTHEAEKTATTQQHAFARAIERAHGIGEAIDAARGES